MARLAVLPVLLALALAVTGCSGDDSTNGTATTSEAVPDTPPVELFVTEDLVQVGLSAVYGPNGTVVLTFSDTETDCVGAQASASLGRTGVTPPGTFDDPDDEQLVAEAVVSCVDFDRLRDHVRTQLADQPALEGVDPACLDREIESLQSQPDVLAAILQGDENGRPAVAGTIAENCST